MSLPERDSSVGHSFGLEVGDLVVTNIMDVTGLKLEQDVIELKENTPDGGYSVKKLPGRWKSGECTLTRGLSGDTGFERLITESQPDATGDARRNGVIIAFDSEGQQIRRYTVTNMWPRSLEIGTLKAGDTSVLTEKLVLTYERLEVE